MLKKFFKDSLIYTVSGFLLKGISFILLPIYTRVLSPEDYGLIDLLATLFSLLSVTVCLEITQAVGRYLPDAKDNEDESLAISRTGIWFSIIMNFVFMFFFILSSERLSVLILGSNNYQLLIKLTGINLFIYGVFYAIQNQIRWQLMSKANATLSFVSAIITISSTIYYVIYLKMAANGVILGQISGSLCGLIFSFRFVKNIWRPYINGRILRQMLLYSYPLVFSSLGVILTQYTDRISLNYFLGLTEVGIYGLAFRICNTIDLVFIGIKAGLTPLIFNYYKDVNTPSKIAFIFRYFFSISILLVLVLSCFSDIIISFFAPIAYYNAAYVMPYILFSIIFNGAYLFSPGLSLNGKTKVITFLNLFALFINLILNIILLPIIGFIGAGIATFTASLVYISLMFYINNKYYFIPYNFKKIVIVLLFSIIISLSINYLKMDLIYELIIKISLISLIVALLFKFSFIAISDISRMVLLFKKKVGI
jgi:O-antigen/teichoic acid export membrane protein